MNQEIEIKHLETSDLPKAVWVLYKIVFDGYLLATYFMVQHNTMHNNFTKEIR